MPGFPKRSGLMEGHDGARFDNDALGIARLLASLANVHLDTPHLVVIEPTGRYHLALWRALDEAGHGAAPINPYAARRLAEGLGRLAMVRRPNSRRFINVSPWFGGTLGTMGQDWQHPHEIVTRTIRAAAGRCREMALWMTSFFWSGSQEVGGIG